MARLLGCVSVNTQGTGADHTWQTDPRASLEHALGGEFLD